MWVEKNTPFSHGYFKRKDIPVHWDIADGWTVQDMYTVSIRCGCVESQVLEVSQYLHVYLQHSLVQESILAATDPNRVHWMSGTVNVPGTPTNPDGSGGMILDNNATPGKSIRSL